MMSFQRQGLKRLFSTAATKVGEASSNNTSKSSSVKRILFGSAVLLGTIEVTTHIPSEGRSSKYYHQIADDVGTPLMRQFLNAEDAHEIAIQVLSSSFASKLMPKYRPSAIEQRLNMSTTIDFISKSDKKIKKLVFPNVIGLAAGFDKDGQCILPLGELGFGFIEIGSVCLHPQPGNPSPRMFRLKEDQAIINRYGFNSLGSEIVEEHLKDYGEKLQNGSNHPRKPLLGANLGLNKTSTTPTEDYQQLIRRLGPYADYLVVNVSSPNTPGLRDLQFSLQTLLQACLQARDELDGQELPPLFVKLAPDLTDEQLQTICQVLIQVGIDGIIVTNTTIQRPASLLEKNESLRYEEGGLSGRPLKDLSTEIIRTVYNLTKDHGIPIIGVGGIFTADDVYEKLKAGASVVQIYSSMVYQGPGTVTKLRHDLSKLCETNGHRNIKDIVGLDHSKCSKK